MTKKQATLGYSVGLAVLSTAEVVCNVWWARALLSTPIILAAMAGVNATIDRLMPSSAPPPTPPS